MAEADSKEGAPRRPYTPKARKVSLAPPPLDEKPRKTAPTHRDALRALEGAWRITVRGPRRRAVVFAGVLLTTVAMFVARGGTTPSRLTATLVLLATMGGAVAVWVLERRIFRSPTKTIHHVAARVEPEAAQRAIRSLSLLDPATSRGVSGDLAELHVTRSLAALPLDGVRKGAERVAFWLGILALGLAVVNIAA